MTALIAPDISPQRAPVNKKSPKTLLWTAVWVSLYFVGIFLLSAIDGPDGQPWIETSVLGESVKTLGLVASALGPSLVTVIRDGRVVKHEVKNDHSTNLRVENDSRHKETRGWIEDLRRDLHLDLGGVRQEIQEDRNAVRQELRADREAVREGLKRLESDLRTHVRAHKTKGQGDGSD